MESRKRIISDDAAKYTSKGNFFISIVYSHILCSTPKSGIPSEMK